MEEMRDRIVAAAKRQRNKCAEFLRELIETPSESQGEEQIAMMVRQRMLDLDYDAVDVDRFGNVIGRIGDGPKKIIYDAHMDTTGIGDRSSWRFDPYRGDFKAGKVYGHGATNNKGGLSAIIHAGGIIRDLDLAPDCSVYVVGSIQAEQCEGVAYKGIFDVEKLYPHFVVLSMPTGMRICRGHRGRAEVKVTLRGQPVHSSDPEKGFNCIYGIADIVQGVKALNETLPEDKFLGKATVAVTHVETDNNGPNALPESCHLIIDRRLVPKEDAKKVLAEVKTLAKGTRSKIEIVEFDAASYRGLRLPMEKFFPPWSIEEDHPLVRALQDSYKSVFKKDSTIDRWTMSTAGAYTNGVAGVPTVGFGPSEESFSGPINDHVRVDDLEKCMAVYASIPGYLPDTEPIKIPRRRR